MSRSTLAAIHAQYCETQSLILHLTDSLSPQQWTTRQDSLDSPIAFHVWHIAREADLLQVALYGALQMETSQIWEREQLARQWSLPTEMLGVLQSGIGMDERDVAGIVWPSRYELSTYLRKAFDAVNAAIQIIDRIDTQLVLDTHATVTFDGAATVERAILQAIASGNRHLGVIGWLGASLAAPEHEIYSRSTATRHHIATVATTRFISDN